MNGYDSFFSQQSDFVLIFLSLTAGNKPYHLSAVAWLDVFPVRFAGCFPAIAFGRLLNLGEGVGKIGALQFHHKNKKALGVF